MNTESPELITALAELWQADDERKLRTWARGIIANAGGDVSAADSAPLAYLREWRLEVEGY